MATVELLRNLTQVENVIPFIKTGSRTKRYNNLQSLILVVSHTSCSCSTNGTKLSVETEIISLLSSSFLSKKTKPVNTDRLPAFVSRRRFAGKPEVFQ